jgi:molybdenum cofactor biosynthesis enzyme MoaA
MPEEGVPLTPKESLMTANEVERVAKLFVKEGVNKIRLTGGEPTVRKDLPEVIGERRRTAFQWMISLTFACLQPVCLLCGNMDSSRLV